jgi:hypothetical protein
MVKTKEHVAQCSFRMFTGNPDGAQQAMLDGQDQEYLMPAGIASWVRRTGRLKSN